jgi:outer membrane protein assembly factor BamB
MRSSTRLAAVLVGWAMLIAASLLAANNASAQDWPQWRGPNRDAKVVGFKAPETWPKQLKQQWKITVGDGVGTPALVGDKLYVFTMQDKHEVIRCLEAATGKELWQDKYEAQGATGASGGFPGPRASPTVADGKVVTLGVRGTVSCLEADSGKKLWRKDDLKGYPRFFTSSSPIVVDGLCITQLGSDRDGAIVAYDLASGEQKWKWTGDGTAYASPSLLMLDGAKVLVTETAANIVGLGLADGKLLWKTPFAVQGMGYNAASPIVEGQTVIYTGTSRGARAVKIAKEGESLAAKELWNNKEKSMQYNTPVVKDGLLYGLTQWNELFCINLKDGKTAWSVAVAQGSGGKDTGGKDTGGKAKSGKKGRGGGRGGYGSIVDAGSVLLALTPSSELIVFKPSEKEFSELARIKVADTPTYAYPVISGNRIFIKDQESLTLWTVQ